MVTKINRDGNDVLGDIDSNASSSYSHCSDLSDCVCNDCIDASKQRCCWTPIVSYRDGDIVKIQQNVLAFIMETRRRQRFPILALPMEVRFLILRELLYHNEPLDFGFFNDTCHRHSFSCRCRNFYFHPQILATCHQLHEEGSAILMHQNVFTLDLYGNEFHTDSMQWMDFVSNPSINSRMEHSDHFKLISKLKVKIVFEDNDGHLPLLQAATRHKFLVYDLVDKLISRAEPLSSLRVHCLFDFHDDAVPLDVYRLNGDTAGQIRDDEPSSIEQFILEPLANLQNTAHELSFSGMTSECEDFLNRQMESLERFRCDQRLRNEIMSN